MNYMDFLIEAGPGKKDGPLSEPKDKWAVNNPLGGSPLDPKLVDQYKRDEQEARRNKGWAKNNPKSANAMKVGAGIAGVAGLWYLYKKYKARGEDKKAAAIKAKIENKS